MQQVPSGDIEQVKQQLIAGCQAYSEMMNLHAQVKASLHQGDKNLAEAVQRMAQVSDTLLVSGQAASDHDWTLAALMALPILNSADQHHRTATTRCRDLWNKQFADQMSEGDASGDRCATGSRSIISHLARIERWSKTTASVTGALRLSAIGHRL